jgi:ABC-type uncharacterized transport system ATPase subunit
MINSLKFKKDWRCFTKGKEFPFREGVNLLVGDQGTGKSSIFTLLVNKAKSNGSFDDIFSIKATKCVVQSFDFEKDNPRKKGISNTKSNAEFRNNLLSKFVSHGQTNLKIIKCLQELYDKKEPHVLLMDEPDMALSIRSINLLVSIFRELASKGHQIIATAHNQVLIEAFDNVLSLEHGEWMSSADFVKSHSS